MDDPIPNGCIGRNTARESELRLERARVHHSLAGRIG